jgi:D-inositol-3-phosphate glycosyltransferase
LYVIKDYRFNKRIADTERCFIMRIAFLGPSYPWRGGISHFAHNMAEKLVEQGNEVMMFSFIHQYPALLFPGSDQFDNSKLVSKLPTCRVLTPYNPLTWITTISNIKGWKPDVLLVQYWLPFMAPSFGFILGKLKNVKKIYIVHNAESHEKWLFANYLSRYALKKADLFISLSAVSTASLLGLIPEISRKNILQLYHPVYEYPLTPVNNTDNKSNKNLLFFGFVKHYKGLDVLLRALPIVLKEIPDIKLIVAGDVYGDKAPYLDLISVLGIQENVEIHFRYIPEEEIGELFACCDVSVVPYRTATQSGVAQMSFAYEVPIIATKVGGLEEVVIDNVNGFLVESENPEALARKIVEFYMCDNINRFKDNIRKQNNQYSWAGFVQKFLEFIE